MTISNTKNNDEFLLVQYADSLRKSTSDLTTTDMYKFSKWCRSTHDKRSKRKSTKKS